eukprot:NODE_21_length_38511_cov_0.503306.p4 type:complete len:853 gc:universal NODE_21_length_38511_cov_0.503306:2736-5294(+)
MYRLDHKIPSIRLRHLEQLHRHVFLNKTVDVEYVKKQFAMQYKLLTNKELNMYGEIFEYLWNRDNTYFGDIQEPLEYLYCKSNIDIPRELNKSEPLYFYDDNEKSNSNSVIYDSVVFPSDLNDPDAVFTFSCDYFPNLTTDNQSNQFLISLLNTDYFSLIFQLYLIYHPLNIRLLKPYILHINDPFYVYNFLVNINPSDYQKSLQIIFPLLKLVDSNDLLMCVANSVTVCTEYLLKHSLIHFQLFEYVCLIATSQSSYEILLYFICHGELKHISHVFNLLLSRNIYENDFVISAALFNQRDYLLRSTVKPISVATILFFNLAIPMPYEPIFNFSRSPALNKTSQHLISPKELQEFHLIYKSYIQNPTDNELLHTYHELLTHKCQPSLNLLKLLKSNTDIISKKLYHLATLISSIPLFKCQANLTLFLNKHFYVYDISIDWPLAGWTNIEIEPSYVTVTDNQLILMPFDVNVDYSGLLNNVDPSNLATLHIIRHLAPHVHLIINKSLYLLKIKDLINFCCLHPLESSTVIILSLLSKLNHYLITKYIKTLNIKWDTQLPLNLQNFVSGLTEMDIHHYYRYLSSVDDKSDMQQIFTISYLLYNPIESIKWHELTKLAMSPMLNKIVPHIPKTHLSTLLTEEIVLYCIQNKLGSASLILSQLVCLDDLLENCLNSKMYKCAYNMMLYAYSNKKKISGIKISNAPQYVQIMGLILGLPCHVNYTNCSLNELIALMDTSVHLPRHVIQQSMNSATLFDKARLLVKLSLKQMYLAVVNDHVKDLLDIKTSYYDIFYIIMRNLAFYKMGWRIVQDLMKSDEYLQRLIKNIKMNRVNTEKYYTREIMIKGIRVVELVERN